MKLGIIDKGCKFMILVVNLLLIKVNFEIGIIIEAQLKPSRKLVGN